MIDIDWVGFSGFDTIDMFLFQYCLVGKTDRCVIPPVSLRLGDGDGGRNI